MKGHSVFRSMMKANLRTYGVVFAIGTIMTNLNMRKSRRNDYLMKADEMNNYNPHNVHRRKFVEEMRKNKI
ncbi:hypothetical protein MHBO_001422 [Bonamia ostreae]|uniref:Uncharacterized protein n=1 Tax=Bonamia ostreae TaxID=126728 RepID=A0ABV2AIY2_9EUKA